MTSVSSVFVPIYSLLDFRRYNCDPIFNHAIHLYIEYKLTINRMDFKLKFSPLKLNYSFRLLTGMKLN